MFVELIVAATLMQRTDPAAVVHELEGIEQQLTDTWKKGDCAGWGAMLAPEWSVIHITGQVITRAEALEMCKGPRPPIAALNVEDLSVRAFGDAAVVTGRTTMKTAGDSPGTLTLRFTDVFIRRDGRWQAVASHATRLGT